MMHSLIGFVMVEFAAIAVFLLFWRSSRMLDINGLLKEVEVDLNKEKIERAKRQLKDKLRQIDNAKLILANLEREKADLMVSITDGTN
jgi:hypothetical protein